MEEFMDLIAMRKSDRKPEIGDVFVVQPQENEYYLGKVIESNVISENLNFKGMNLIYLYNCRSSVKQLPEKMMDCKLLLPPTVVSTAPWKNGYFETIGNIPVSAIEKTVDFGFFEHFDKKDVYFNLAGEQLEHKPQYTDFNGLSSFRTIGKEMQRLLYGRKFL